jgi:hypothetical protein
MRDEETMGRERTDDTDFEVITWTTKKDFLLLNRCLFWRHSLFTGGKCRSRERKGSMGVGLEAGADGPATKQAQSISRFQKKGHWAPLTADRTCSGGSHTLAPSLAVPRSHTPLPTRPRSSDSVQRLLSLHEGLQCRSPCPFPHNLRLIPTTHHHYKWVRRPTRACFTPAVNPHQGREIL